jgi:hypothetical protein
MNEILILAAAVANIALCVLEIYREYKHRRTEQEAKRKG